MKLYILTEIGFDTTIETQDSLIKKANFHCKSYDDRKHYLPIDTVTKAINYFIENGFEVSSQEIEFKNNQKKELEATALKIYKKPKTYYVKFQITGEFITKIETCKNDAKIEELAAKEFYEAHFGALKNMEVTSIEIEEENKKRIS